MNVLTAQQIKAWDQYTIKHEPIASVGLMERAAGKCVEWIKKQHWHQHPFKIFCGKGNNGGDGLAIARMLIQSGYSVAVYILEFGKPGTKDFQYNLQQLHELPCEIYYIQTEQHFPEVHPDDIIIDALFGSGLDRPLDGLSAAMVKLMNGSGALIVSIDVPSGLFLDWISKGNPVVDADHTLTFQCYKLGLLVQENASCVGEVHVLDIGLLPQYLNEDKFDQQIIDESLVKIIYKPRNPFAHKGIFGHALLVSGSYGKMGAAVLAAKSCLRTGSGLLTCHIPECGYVIMQTAVPEAMVEIDEHPRVVAELPEGIEKYSTIGIGPGIGTAEETQKLLSYIIRRYQKAMVLDADGLNCLAIHKDLLGALPRSSIITPHPKEFDRLFGDHDSDFERIITAKKKAKELNIIVIVKGHHTLVATPGGRLYFNNTGNAGMAKGGSGDVLTGIITALLAQRYEPVNAAIFGVYLHGLAGDLAAKALSQEAMIATDLIMFLSQAFLTINHKI